ncbi:MAG: hypothetical protein L6R42_009181 [Xanthoria sp. 1 TBL-2021]|nr:MAG: hypothetical protein L6R42_009181 [Xanthoria sp. 1 TBL-2021]
MACFANLPPELLCGIFESASDFSTIIALSLTSRLFHTIWLTHSHRIAATVTPRVIPNLTSAESLATAQEETEPQLPLFMQQQDKHVQVVSRLRRLLHNARLVSLVCDSWVAVCAIHLYPHRDPKNPHTSPSERLRFQRAFYRLWTLGVMPPPNRSRSLDMCTPRELTQLGEMAEWVQYYTDNDLVALGLDFRDQMWRDVCEEVQAVRWMTGTTVPDFTPFAFFAFFDHTREYLELVPDS